MTDPSRSDHRRHRPSHPSLRRRRRRPMGRATARSSSGCVILGVGLWYFADRTLGLELPRLEADQLWPIAVIAVGAWLIVRPAPLSVMVDDWVQGDGSADDRVWLADWRRQVAALYAEVRALAATDASVAHRHWREVRERLFREHPQSPVPVAARATFRAAHFEYDPAMRIDRARRTGATATTRRLRARAAQQRCRYALVQPRRARDHPVRWRGTRAIRLLDGGLCGWPVHPVPRRHQWAPRPTVPDGTSWTRAKSADLGGAPETGTLTLDFNFAFQPSCAFDPRWACPLAPPENRLDLAIRAGERLLEERAA